MPKAIRMISSAEIFTVSWDPGLYEPFTDSEAYWNKVRVALLSILGGFDGITQRKTSISYLLSFQMQCYFLKLRLIFDSSGKTTKANNVLFPIFFVSLCWSWVKIECFACSVIRQLGDSGLENHSSVLCPFDHINHNYSYFVACAFRNFDLTMLFAESVFCRDWNEFDSLPNLFSMLWLCGL